MSIHPRPPGVAPCVVVVVQDDGKEDVCDEEDDHKGVEEIDEGDHQTLDWGAAEEHSQIALYLRGVCVCVCMCVCMISESE